MNKGKSGPGYMFSKVETLYKDLGTAFKSSSNLRRLYVLPGLVFGFLSICSNMAMRAAERSSKGNSSVGGGGGAKFFEVLKVVGRRLNGEWAGQW